ncbi:MAG: hypothetical protein LBK82_04275 [Planctomycetaceae bacterium]|nr:hypothetical protein [Planctomycetaceae bacterium]
MFYRSSVVPILTSKRKATPFAVAHLVHSRLTPTRPFSERSPTFGAPT